MSALSHFMKLLEQAILEQNGEQVRHLLRDSSEEEVAAINEYYATGGPIPAGPPGPWESLPELVSTCFTTAGSIRMNDWVDAYGGICDALSEYLNILASDDDWSMPLFHQLCEDVRVIARVADEQLRTEHRKPSKMENAERILKRGFSVVNNDRREVGDGSRRIGALGIINDLFKVYFKINNLSLCLNLTRTVGTSSFPPFESFPLLHRVTYKFYAGRLALYDDRYEEAIDNLTYALQHTPHTEGNNRRRVMLFLIPSKILIGSLPSQKTLDSFNMIWYQDIVAALRSGHVGRFESAFERYEEFFIRNALYLSIIKMKTLVYRTMIRQVGYMINQIKLPLDYLVLSMQLGGVDAHRDEVECMLAVLIHQNFIKGYISHKVGFLVLSKKNAFPPVKTLKL